MQNRKIIPKKITKKQIVAAVTKKKKKKTINIKDPLEEITLLEEVVKPKKKAYKRSKYTYKKPSIEENLDKDQPYSGEEKEESTDSIGQRKAQHWIFHSS